MKSVGSNKDHGESYMPLHTSWVGWKRRMQKKGIILPDDVLDWKTFRATRPTPKEYITGEADAFPGLLNPALGYTADNIGWVLRAKRRES